MREMRFLKQNRFVKIKYIPRMSRRWKAWKFRANKTRLKFARLIPLVNRYLLFEIPKENENRSARSIGSGWNYDWTGGWSLVIREREEVVGVDSRRGEKVPAGQGVRV